MPICDQDEEIELERYDGEELSSSSQVDFDESQNMDPQERQPLIPAAGTSSPRGLADSSSRRRAASRRQNFSSSPDYKSVASSSSCSEASLRFAEYEDFPPSRFRAIMEKLSQSKVARWVDKLHVESEPGLSTTQLMLTNHDLKPVEPERRQWGAWNFVGFWIGMQCEFCADSSMLSLR